MHRKIVPLLCALLALAGCATVQVGDKSEEARLKQFTPVPGKTNLYVCREGGYLVAAGVRSMILLDGREIGVVKPNMFVHAVVEPGKHVVSMRNDGIAGSLNPIDFETKAGENSYIWVGVTGHGFGVLTEDFFPTVEAAQACVRGATYAVLAPQ